MSLDPKTIIQSAEIPSIPHVLQQILSLADNPRTSSTDLEKYVTQEPALVAQLLKWVNSAAYSLPQRVSSIAHAMIILGFSTVKSIASGMVLVNAFDDITGLPKEFVEHVWKHTLTAAAIIKIVSKKEAVAKRDELFLSAMIHDVGYMVMYQYFGDKYAKLAKNEPYPTVQSEKKLFGIDHMQIGSALLEEWNFPPMVINLVKQHHGFEDAEEDDNKDIQRDLYYLKLSDHLAEMDDINDILAEEDQELVDPDFIEELQEIGWTWAELRGTQEEIQDSISTIDGLMGR